MTRTHQQRAVDKIVRNGRRRQFQHERETMTDADLEERVVKVIVDTMLARGRVLVADLMAANLPIERIDPVRLARCMDRACKQCPAITRIGAEA